MFAFKFDKALQAAAVLLRRASAQQMTYLRLLKVLYIADRESIRQSGCPITGARVKAMKYGPVLSEVFDLIHGEHLRSPDWSACIQKNDYDVRLVRSRDPGVAALCRFEIDLLNRVADEHRSRGDWELVEYTHDFPEWIKNAPENAPGESKANLIPLHDILEAVGRLDDKADIEENARVDQVFARLFGGA